jgi:hypothetical protein
MVFNNLNHNIMARVLSSFVEGQLAGGICQKRTTTSLGEVK